MWRSSALSLPLAGSPSAAFTTTTGGAGRPRRPRSFFPVGKPPPPRPRSPLASVTRDEVAARVERPEGVEMLVQGDGPAVAADGGENAADAGGREHGAARCGQRHAGLPVDRAADDPGAESMFSANWSWSRCPASVRTTVWTCWPLERRHAAGVDGVRPGRDERDAALRHRNPLVGGRATEVDADGAPGPPCRRPVMTTVTSATRVGGLAHFPIGEAENGRCGSATAARRGRGGPATTTCGSRGASRACRRARPSPPAPARRGTRRGRRAPRARRGRLRRGAAPAPAPLRARRAKTATATTASDAKPSSGQPAGARVAAGAERVRERDRPRDVGEPVHAAPACGGRTARGAGS